MHRSISTFGAFIYQQQDIITTHSRILFFFHLLMDTGEIISTEFFRNIGCSWNCLRGSLQLTSPVPLIVSVIRKLIATVEILSHEKYQLYSSFVSPFPEPVTQGVLLSTGKDSNRHAGGRVNWSWQEKVESTAQD